MSESSFVVKYGTLLAALTAVGIIGGVWGCKMFGSPDKDNCVNYYAPGTILGVIFASIVLCGVMLMHSEYSYYGIIYSIGLPLAAFITMITSAGVWGCQTCGGTIAGAPTQVQQNSVMIWSSFIFSIITLVGVILIAFPSIGGGGVGIGDFGPLPPLKF